MKRLLISTLIFMMVFSWTRISFAEDAGSTDPSRLMLQQLGPHSVIVKWRDGADEVCWANGKRALFDSFSRKCANATMTESDHKEVYIVGLEPKRQYFYTLGEPSIDSFNNEQYFITAPEGNDTPTDGNTRLWLLGDNGSITELSDGSPKYPYEQESTRQGFLEFNQGMFEEDIDLVVLLGDNAYAGGTDEEWQGAFFDFYPNLINKVATVPTIGNHEMGYAPFDMSPVFGLPAGSKVVPSSGSSESSDPNSYDDNNPDTIDDGMPYLKVFTLPSNGEMGGVASGTEQYYSYDYGNIHIVSLDSQLSAMDDEQRETMKEWLIEDLSFNYRDWTIVIFHHPIYSKAANHDSDFEIREVYMRETFVPVFEEYGVDIVYSGHTHSYERSYYVTGHHGQSSTFDPQIHAELTDSGELATGNCGEAYDQINDESGLDDQVVYVVTGSAGKTSHGQEQKPCTKLPPESWTDQLGCLSPDWLQHPVHQIDYDVLGSAVLDVTEHTLTHRFISEDGEVFDEFVIERGRGYKKNHYSEMGDQDFSCSTLPEEANPEPISHASDEEGHEEGDAAEDDAAEDDTAEDDVAEGDAAEGDAAEDDAEGQKEGE